MDLFQRLKAQKAAAEAAKKNTVTVQPVKPIASAPRIMPAEESRAYEEPPKQFMAGLRRPAAAPNPPAPRNMHSHEVPETHGIEFDPANIPAHDTEAFDIPEDLMDEDLPQDDDDLDYAGPAVSHVQRRPALRRAVAHPAPVTHDPEPIPEPEPPKAKPITLPPRQPITQAPAAKPEERKMGIEEKGQAMLASLRARAAAQSNGLTAPIVHPGMSEAKQLAASISDFSVEEFINEWPDAEDVDAEANELRASLLARAANHLQTVFSNELDMNKIKSASDLSINEVAKISKLCFLRVKDSPSAYDMLDQVDRDTLVKGLLVSAAKRHSMAKNRKPNEAKELSSALEVLASQNPDLADMLGGFNMEF